jgi:hypothetical protein
MTYFKKRYGAGPLHLAVHVIGFAVAGFAIVQLLDQRRWVNWLAWFLAAALLHDLVLLPLYSALDRIIRGRAPRLPDRHHVPIVNHLRAPALISGVLLLIYFPLILGQANSGYLSATGHHPEGYLRNWLLITVALFAGSGVVYAVRRWRRQR